MVVVLLVWLGVEIALVQGSDGENVKQNQVGSHRVGCNDSLRFIWFISIYTIQWYTIVVIEFRR